MARMARLYDPMVSNSHVRRLTRRPACLVFLAVTCLWPGAASARKFVAVPERVVFLSADEQTAIIGYLFQPQRLRSGTPAVVMLHGRRGAYSLQTRGTYGPATLTARHRRWGQLWAEQGFIALLVDDFTPFGYPTGFGAHSYSSRPPELNEVDLRPLHAYGALTYLKSRPEVDGDRIALMGWSNGGSAVLAAMGSKLFAHVRQSGFKAAVAIYPGCGLRQRFAASPYRPYAPVRVYIGASDEEVSASECRKLVSRSRFEGGKVNISIYQGAGHGFDTPIPRIRRVPANVAADTAAVRGIVRFMTTQLSSLSCSDCIHVAQRGTNQRLALP